MRKTMAWMVSLALVLGLGLAAVSQEFDIPDNLPELHLPILATTCGQSPGALMVSLLCNEAGLACQEADLLTADEFLSECSEEQIDTMGVLFVTTGTSLKGMGAAGVDLDSEIARCTALIEAARSRGMTIIVGQIEGPSRRVDEYDEASISSMSPLADLLITRSDVDDDGYFTTLAEENGIPQIFITDTLDLGVLLPLLFPQQEG